MRTAAILGGLALSALASKGALAQETPPAPKTIALGDWQLAPEIQVRTRGEYRRDAVDLGGVDLAGSGGGPRVRNAYGVLERARVGLGAEDGPVGVKVTLQDARAWGQPGSDAVLGAGAGTTGLYEAWMEAKTSSAHPTYLRLGRQAITWGDGRLVGNADWSPTARTLDAARAHTSIEGLGGAWDFEAMAAILDAPRPLGPGTGDTFGPPSTGSQLYGVQAAYALDPLLAFELSGLARVVRGDDAALDGSRFFASRALGETYIASLRVHGADGDWKYSVEGAYEAGRAALLASSTVSAYAAAGYVERRFDDVDLAPAFRLEADYASGDDGGSTYRQFDPLLPTVHEHHGAMDAFAWSNAIQASARVTVEPMTEARAAVEYRYARMADAHGEWMNGYLQTIGRGDGSSAELGHEIDAWLAWEPGIPSTPLSLVAGYSLFMMGDGARAILASQGRGAVSYDGTVSTAALSHYAYLQATLRVP